MTNSLVTSIYFRTRVGDNSERVILRSLVVCRSPDIRFKFLSKAIKKVHLLLFFRFFENFGFFEDFGFFENFGFFEILDFLKHFDF